MHDRYRALPLILLMISTLTCEAAAIATEPTTQPAPVRANNPPEKVRWQAILGPIDIDLIITIDCESELAPCRARADIPQLGIENIPLSDLVTTETRLGFTVLPPMPVTFDGGMMGEGRQLLGTWQTPVGALPMAFVRVNPDSPLPPGPPRLQTPQPPYPYQVQAVRIQSPAGQVELSGTLTIPSPPGLHPAVILLTGAFPQDRDENILGHRPLHVIADRLTRAGVVTLRMDDRGMGDSGGRLLDATYEDLVQDVGAMLGFLRSDPRIDSDRIGLVGHSEGGMIASMVAARSTDVAFVVLMAAPALPMREMLRLYNRNILPDQGWDAARIERVCESALQLSEMLASGESMDQIEESLGTELFNDQFMASLMILTQPLPPVPKAVLRSFSPESYRELLGPMLNCTYIRALLGHDPQPFLRRLNVPILALNGLADIHVPAKTNLDATRRLLGEGKNPPLTRVEFPGVNHLFQDVHDGTTLFTSTHTIAPEVLDALTEWIVTQTGAAKPNGAISKKPS